MARVSFVNGNTSIFPGSCAEALQSPSLALLSATWGGPIACEEAGDDQPPPVTLASMASPGPNLGLREGLIGAIGGFIAGGPAGAVAGAAAGFIGGGDDQPPGPGAIPAAPLVGTGCPPGTISVRGNCLDLQPGGATQGQGILVGPAMPVGAGASTSAVGSASSPSIVSRSVRRCGRGFVLADLGNGALCYHRKLIPNRLRLYPKPPKPALTARDKRQIKKYARGGTKAEQIRELAKELGYKVTLS